MSAAPHFRVAFEIAASVVVLVLALMWGSVPVVLGPCPYEPEHPYSLGTCILGPSTLQWILKLPIALIAIATVAALAAQGATTRKRVVGATAAALTALVGLTTLQVISRQVFVVGYAPPIEAIAVVGGAFFLFGAFVVWATEKWPEHTIPSGIGAISCAWIAIGLSLGTWAIGELATQDYYAPAVKPWVIILALSILTMVAGLTFRRGTVLGRVLVRVVSGLTLLYSASWLHLGGLEEAIGYWPAIVLAVALSIYSLVVSLRQVRPNQRLERP